MKKYTYEEVKSYFDKSNLTLLSKEYVNCKEPLQYICNCHFDKGIQFTTFDRVKNRYIYTCKYCAIEAVTSKNRIDIERVKSACKTLNFEFVDMLLFYHVFFAVFDNDAFVVAVHSLS